MLAQNSQDAMYMFPTSHSITRHWEPRLNRVVETSLDLLFTSTFTYHSGVSIITAFYDHIQKDYKPMLVFMIVVVVLFIVLDIAQYLVNRRDAGADGDGETGEQSLYIL